MIYVTDTFSLDERELDERFVRASGPGGQNVNKVSTAVELRFNVSASSLPDEAKHRLLKLAGSRVSAPSRTPPACRAWPISASSRMLPAQRAPRPSSSSYFPLKGSKSY